MPYYASLHFEVYFINHGATNKLKNNKQKQGKECTLAFSVYYL